jgi:hypothetical protein
MSPANSCCQGIKIELPISTYTCHLMFELTFWTLLLSIQSTRSFSNRRPSVARNLERQWSLQTVDPSTACTDVPSQAPLWYSPVAHHRPSPFSSFSPSEATGAPHHRGSRPKNCDLLDGVVAVGHTERSYTDGPKIAASVYRDQECRLVGSHRASRSDRLALSCETPTSKPGRSLSSELPYSRSAPFGPLPSPVCKPASIIQVRRACHPDLHTASHRKGQRCEMSTFRDDKAPMRLLVEIRNKDDDHSDRVGVPRAAWMPRFSQQGPVDVNGHAHHVWPKTGLDFSSEVTDHIEAWERASRVRLCRKTLYVRVAAASCPYSLHCECYAYTALIRPAARRRCGLDLTYLRTTDWPSLTSPPLRWAVWQRQDVVARRSPGWHPRTGHDCRTGPDVALAFWKARRAGVHREMCIVAVHASCRPSGSQGMNGD